jgi:hypothetical protein
MIRRFVIVGLAASLATPGLIATPAAAAVLFTCPGIELGGPGDQQSTIYWGPEAGLRHTPAAQDVRASYVRLPGSCTNGGGYVKIGTFWGGGHLLGPTVTYPPRPLGCPVAWGGAGPDYADQTPILLGGNRSFLVYWYADGSASYGITKVKAGTIGTEYKFVLNINDGAYAPPAGKKTKLKFPVAISPAPNWSYSCTDNSDPIEYLMLDGAGSVIATQQ